MNEKQTCTQFIICCSSDGYLSVKFLHHIGIPISFTMDETFHHEVKKKGFFFFFLNVDWKSKKKRTSIFPGISCVDLSSMSIIGQLLLLPPYSNYGPIITRFTHFMIAYIRRLVILLFPRITDTYPAKYKECIFFSFFSGRYLFSKNHHC